MTGEISISYEAGCENDETNVYYGPLSQVSTLSWSNDICDIGTSGTAGHLRGSGVACEDVFKVLEGRPNIVDLMKNGEVDLIVNTPLGKESYYDEKRLRVVATQRGVPLVTTLSGGHAMVEAIQALRDQALDVASLQETYPAK